MYKHFVANKYLPIGLALAAFTATSTAPVLAQQSGWGAGISSRNAQPYVHQQSINHHSGYSAYARITDHRRPDPFGESEWFNR
jgi:hypothetical protein